jgi:hypothetical protein
MHVDGGLIADIAQRLESPNGTFPHLIAFLKLITRFYHISTTTTVCCIFIVEESGQLQMELDDVHASALFILRKVFPDYATCPHIDSRERDALSRFFPSILHHFIFTRFQRWSYCAV